ncbi:S-adenosyl-L-methionine-dependent methyltransferase [Jimgerdemannia flammicorona]|uniref:S-adenosyl-L-methionine-dependent methyltransferase n=1 Tax=Jimgerdemannia flammicorona TaxID=994334 RepID=A0A433D9W9_9FUNG|nr:S-adenosyl-L-methionine-dependent methyltransferase [Jimgerdemannia flammicorona]
MGQKLSRPRKRSIDPPSTWTDTSSPGLPPGFKWIEGRAFKEAGNPAYPLPNDHEEANRLNSQHYQIRFLLEGNHKAPLRNELRRGIRVLDAGCGTGVWSIEMAREYPASQFVGSDFVDVFSPFISVAPKNLRFEVANTLELPYEDESFDFVFQRFQSASFRKDEWPKAFAELARVTKPGGWVEFIENNALPNCMGPQTAIFYEHGMDKSVSPLDIHDKPHRRAARSLHLPFPHAFKTVWQLFNMRGINPKIVESLDQALKTAGLEDIVFDKVSFPVGWGPNEIASVGATNVTKIMNNLKPQLVLALGIEDDDYDAMVDEASDEFVKYKTYWDVYYAFGRKPAVAALV